MNSLYNNQDFIGEYLSNKRISIVSPYINGYLVDLSCGDNKLVRNYGNGVGVDIINYGDVDYVLSDIYKLPFKSGSIDTVTMLACLNYYENPELILFEVHRILKVNGCIILTLPNHFIMHFWFKIRSAKAIDEKGNITCTPKSIGMSEEYIMEVFHKCKSYQLVKKKKFMGFMNRLYIFRKNE